MSGIEAKRDGDKVRITVRVGEKTARLGVTPEYARGLARDLMTAALEAEEKPGVANNLRKSIDALFDGLLGKKP